MAKASEKYEVMYIINPNFTEEQTAAVVEKFKALVEANGTLDEMEEMGVVGPFVGSKPRQILITKEQWDQMKQGQTIVTQPSEPVPEEDIDIPF